MEHHKAKPEYVEYRQASNVWEQKYDEGKEQQPKSIRVRLKQHEAKKDRNEEECLTFSGRGGVEGNCMSVM